MYAFSNVNRVYISLFLCLCAAVLLAPSLAVANDGYWSTTERRFISQAEVNNRLNQIANSSIAKPSNSTLSTSPSAPTITKNATGGLSATTNNILKTLDQPSSFSSTLNNSASSAKTALKSCVRSPACAGRALGTGAIIYEGINAWKDVYDILTDNSGTPVIREPKKIPAPDGVNTCRLGSISFPTCQDAFEYQESLTCANPSSSQCPLTTMPISSTSWNIISANGGALITMTLESNVCPSGAVNSFDGCVSPTETVDRPLSDSELDDMIENYNPEITDAPIVLLSGDSPQSISLTTPASAELPATTTTNTDSQGKTTTTVKNSVITYNVLNNNSSSPSIESTITETSNTYDDTANLVGSMTSTTTNNSVQPDPITPPSSGASADIEIPPFCTWAKIVCDWIGWTQEELDLEEPDLSLLLTDFEPDQDGFDLGIGSGSCPAPMLLNLGIIGKTVEVKYDPFCSFLEMIRPFVLAAAYLFAAYLYIGVLRRG